MKKSVIILGVALVAFANVSMAANHSSSVENPKIEVSHSFSAPLHVAVSKGDLEVVKKFIAYGADVNEQSEDMITKLKFLKYC